MKSCARDAEDLAVKKDEFHRALFTATHCQLVFMALQPKEEVGADIHALDRFLRVEEGSGEAVLDGARAATRAGSVFVVPAGTTHNIVNNGSVPLRLLALHAPPIRRDRVVRHSRDSAEADDEHFDGNTTE